MGLAIVELNNMNLRECFEAQLLTAPEISAEVLEKVEYKRVWSGELIREGDRVLYAMVQHGSDSVLLMSLVERELDTLSNIFVYQEMHNDTIPTLRKIK